MVEAEQSAEFRPTADDASGGIVIGCGNRWLDQPTSQSLMEAFRGVIGDELAKEDTKVPLAEDDEVIETLGPDWFSSSRYSSLRAMRSLMACAPFRSAARDPPYDQQPCRAAQARRAGPAPE